MEVVVKAYLETADGTTEVRRIPVSMAGQSNNNGIFKETVAKVGNAFPGLAGKMFSLKWKDSDGDLVMMSSDEEMVEAVAQAQDTPLKVFIAVEGVKELGSPEDVQADVSEEPNIDGEKGSDHQRQDPFTEMSFDSAPDFDFGDIMNFHGVWGGRKRGHPDSHNPRGCFGNLGARGHHPGHGHHGNHFEHMGPRGHHFDHVGPRGHPFGHMGPRGHHFDHHGPRGHHFDVSQRGNPFGHMGPRGHHFDHLGARGHMGPHGHAGLRGGHHFGLHMGMHGPFGGQGCFEGQEPFKGADMFWGHPFSHHHHHDKSHHEENGWKAKLRDAVPVAHRRWAKTYIRNWRVQNLKNATSTSGDSDQEILTMEGASVPEAYAAWLDIFLSKWHKHQGQEDAGTNNGNEKDSEEKRKLKGSVPLEFRKWTKWYLARHFGKKDSPRFRKHCSFEGKMDKMGKKDWKKSAKIQTLAVSVLPEHRVWAKTFIRDWRREHAIPDSKSGEPVSSGSEEIEKAATEGSVTVPDDYAKWMRRFLAKWHVRDGQIDGQKVQVENGEKGQFKGTIPKSFRKWVKCFLWHRYGKGAAKGEVDTASQYQRWLHAFQQKWLKEQSKECSADEFVLLTSSDDESTTRPFSDGTEKAMESSLKKLRLSQESTSKVVSDSDCSEAEINPGFSHWFKHALWQWDGRSAPDAASDNEQISPRLYRWMAKKMMKMQRKSMKQEFKHAKHSMKAAFKAQRHGHY